ncbi:MAG: nitroreductase family deazaflavin-dependent oxidoreductase [Acidimicrobiia bacterium]|nr:nitroreductase family deazaflavin-dependent oxidoreductase [Acidimicrobiia bacterium]
MAEMNRTLARLAWRVHKLVWYASGGRLGRRVRGMPVLELVTVGRRSGEERQILITYVEDEAGPVVIGTNAGKDRDPAWVHNLRAEPRARARWDGRWRDVTAVELQGDERTRAWERAVSINDDYADYADGLSREIPVIRLEPR